MGAGNEYCGQTVTEAPIGEARALTGSRLMNATETKDTAERLGMKHENTLMLPHSLSHHPGEHPKGTPVRWLQSRYAADKRTRS